MDKAHFRTKRTKDKPSSVIKTTACYILLYFTVDKFSTSLHSYLIFFPWQYVVFKMSYSQTYQIKFRGVFLSLIADTTLSIYRNTWCLLCAKRNRSRWQLPWTEVRFFSKIRKGTILKDGARFPFLLLFFIDDPRSLTRLQTALIWKFPTFRLHMFLLVD